MSTNNSINTNIPVPVTQGGTGLSSFTALNTFCGDGTSPIVSPTGNANGKPLIGSTGAKPVYALIGSTAGSIGRTVGEASLNLDISNYVSAAFTPTLKFGGNNVDMTGTFTGYYMKLSGIIFFTLDIVLTAKGTSTGVATILLPATTSSSVGFLYPCRVSNCTFNTETMGYSGANATVTWVALVKSAQATTLTNTGFTDTSEIHMSGSYLV